MWWMMWGAFAQNWDAEGYAVRTQVALPALHSTLEGIPLRLEGPVGEDARVFDGMGTELPIEREVDASGDATGAWIQVDANTPSPLYLYEGPDPFAGRSTLSPSDVWSRGFRAVYHLDQNNSDMGRDSTAQGFHMENMGATVGPSPAGGELVLDGSSYLEYPRSDQESSRENDFEAGLLEQMSVSAWVSRGSIPSNDTTPWRAVLTKGDNTWRLHRNEPTNGVGWTSTSPTGHISTWCHDAVDGEGTRVHISATFFSGDPTNGEERVYQNGVLCQPPLLNQTGSMNTNNEPVRIGSNSQHTSRTWIGTIDELRISEVVRTPEWIQAVHANLAGPMTRGLECVRGVTDVDGDDVFCDLDCADDNPVDVSTGHFDDDGDGLTAMRLGCTERQVRPSLDVDCDDSDPVVMGPQPYFVDEDGDDERGPVVSTDARCSQDLPDGAGFSAGADACDQDADIFDAVTGYPDRDGDGSYSTEAEDGLCPSAVDFSAQAGDDCNDMDDEIHPGAVDLPGDDVDSDCDGLEPPPMPTPSSPISTPPPPTSQIPDQVLIDGGCGCSSSSLQGIWVLPFGVLFLSRRRH